MEHGLKEAGRKTEGALEVAGGAVKEVFGGVADSFNHMKLRPLMSWPGRAPNSGQHGEPEPRAKANGVGGAGGAPGVGGAQTPASYSGASVGTTAAAAAAAATAAATANGHQATPRPHTASADNGENDAAMRYHCSALERLVGMGLTPQGARAALRHLDSWLTSDEGTREIAAVEAEVEASGEPLLHLGDKVSLQGLVKNPAVNGKVGTLQAYGAESQRWKVALVDSSQVFWVKPKLLRPLALRRLPLHSVEAQGQVQNGAGPGASADGAVLPEQAHARVDSQAAAIRELEAKGAALAQANEAHQARETALLERERTLLELQAQLEEKELHIGRRSHALDQARSLAALEQRGASDEKGGRRITASYSLDGQTTTAPSSVAAASVPEGMSISQQEWAVADDCDEDEGTGDEADEVWDMDWSALSAPAQDGPRKVLGGEMEELLEGAEAQDDAVARLTPKGQAVHR